ncbi:putative nucleotidyltransferase, Ribonuclease H [Helianthus annuus]|nr:putative nucleotidyltransferase, Ribonuclease H [Helianthus annuus]
MVNNAARLDIQDQLIQKLQSDMENQASRLDSIAATLEADRVANAEFRKLMMGFVKQHDKKKEDGFSGSNIFDSGWGSPGPSSGLPYAVKKVKLPEFSGFDPQGWITKARLYFDINETPEELRIKLAQLSMVGVAQHWFTVIKQVRPSISWSEFQEELLLRFSGLEIHNPYEQLATIKQGDSIHDFIDDFEYLMSLVPRLPESQALGYFVAGLRDDVKQRVRLHRPATRLDAMYLAKDVEEMLRPSGKLGSASRFRYLNRYGPSPGLSVDGPNQLGRSEQKGSTRTTDRVSIGRSDISRFPSSFKVGSESSSIFPKDRGMRSLSRSEWEDRRKKGLCFRCGQQYGPAHKCPEGRLRVLLLGEDEYSDTDGENRGLAVDIPSSPIDSPDSPTGNCFSLEWEGSLATFGGGKTLKLEGFLQSILILMLVDSGASHNFVSRRLVSALGFTSTTISGLRIKLGDGNFVLATECCNDLTVTIGSCSFVISALVLDTGDLDLILGMAWLQTLGEVTHDWQNSWMKFKYNGEEVLLSGSSYGSPPASLQQWLSLALDSSQVDSVTSGVSIPLPSSLSPSQQSSLTDILAQYAPIFRLPTSLPPIRSHDHQIILTSPNPICVRPYRYPHAQKAEIERQVQELLTAGMIRPSKSAFSSPVILVRKKDNSWRMCVDYRALNNATVPDKFPIPVVDELIDELHGARLFSKLDLKSGYNQIRMQPDSIEKTAFRTHDGHYEYLVMPFGLMNAPATFQAIMNDIFRPLLRRKVVIFFDDILVYSPSWETHLCDLREVFSILHLHHFMVNQSKCSFGQLKVEYLGYLIDGQGVAMDPTKVTAVLEWPVPKTLKALRGFLGLTGYYRKFVKNYGGIARPLTDLTKKDAFVWNSSAQTAFDQLKHALVSAPVLALPNFAEPFSVECDASGRGIGAVLMQNRKPIAYFSKALSDRNLSKSAYEREMMALVLAVQHWRSYLLGARFTVFTDQKSLKFLLHQRVSTPDQQNWVAKLLGYDFDIEYKPGRENRAADALSRRADSEELFHIVSAPVWAQGAQLISEAQADPEVQLLLQKCQSTPATCPGYSVKNGVLYYKNRLVISRNSKFLQDLFHEFHTTATGGHSGFYRTYRRLAVNLYWPGMTSTIKRLIRECDICQRCKASSTVPGGLLQPLAIPDAIWDDLSMDFISGLPKSKGFSVILVVVDRLSKYAHFILLKHLFTAKSVAETFVKEVVRHHGIPKTIVTDRDPVFVSKFWQEIFRSMGTKLCLSSAYHPETDGQTEVVNRCLEAYLRCFAVDQPKNWALWLPWAEFWYNSTFHASTGTTPFETVYGRRPPSVFQFVPGEIRVEAVAQDLRDRDEALKQLKLHLANAQSSMKLQADTSRRDVHFSVGEWVYVKLKPYRQLSVVNRIHQKLAAKFFGPFQIVEKLGPVAYKLELPATSKIHPVFHVSLLKKAVSGAADTVLPPELESTESNPPIPTAVLASRSVKDGQASTEQWLVKWAGLPDEEASWEDAQWLQAQFPTLSLEDKTSLQGVSIDTNADVGSSRKTPEVRFVYSRRTKGVNSTSG